MSRGSDDIRRRRAQSIANGGRAKAVDLSTAALSDEQAGKLQAELELRLGMRCFGCGRRVTIGLRFASIDVRDAERPAIHRTACNRDDCDFAERCRDGATSMELVEFAWLDAAGADSSAFGMGMNPAPDPDPDAPQREYTGWRWCSRCKRSLPLPKSDVEDEAWGEESGLFVCPECVAAERAGVEPAGG